MKNTFAEMPRAIKIIFIIYILIFLQIISNLVSNKIPTTFYLFGFLISGSLYSTVQLTYGLIYFINISVIYKKLRWGYQFIIFTEFISFIQSLLFAWNSYTNTNLEPAKLVYIFSTLFGTLLTGLFIYYIYKNREYFID